MATGATKREQQRLDEFEKALDALTDGLDSEAAARVLLEALEMMEGALGGVEDVIDAG